MKSRGWEGLVLVFASTFPAVVAWLYFVALAVEGRGANPGLQVVYSAGKVLQFALPLLAIWWFGRPPSRPARGNGLVPGLGFGLAVAAGLFWLAHQIHSHTSLLEATPAQLQSKIEQFGLATPAGFLILAGFLTIIHSFLEEYYWRWFVFGRLRDLIPFWAAVVVSSLGFMAHHVIVLAVYFPGRFATAVVPFSLCIAVGGAFWAWLYDRSGSLMGPWLSHLLVDAAIMAVGYGLLFGVPS